MRDLDIGSFPKCHNTGCKWNMGTKHKDGYKDLDNTCYSGVIAKDCEIRETNKNHIATRG